MGRYADRARKNTIKDEIYKRLSEMFAQGKGRSRHEDKRKGIDKSYIYSQNTYETYKREARHFADWVRERHPEVKNLKQCRQYANDYLQALIKDGKSAYTITTRKAAIAKLYGMSYDSFIATPPRERKNITRSRMQGEHDKHISLEKEQYWGSITSACGLRRSELQRVRGTDMREGTLTLPDGTTKPCYIIHVTRGKGGKSRDVLLWGKDAEDTERIAGLFKDAGEEKVFPHLPGAYDNHHYRAEYAKRIYGMYARPRKDIPLNERYIMRKDRAGEILDRKAMKLVSKLLGHNRIDVIAEHYLY